MVPEPDGGGTPFDIKLRLGWTGAVHVGRALSPLNTLHVPSNLAFSNRICAQSSVGPPPMSRSGSWIGFSVSQTVEDRLRLIHASAAVICPPDRSFLRPTRRHRMRSAGTLCSWLGRPFRTAFPWRMSLCISAMRRALHAPVILDGVGRQQSRELEVAADVSQLGLQSRTLPRRCPAP